MRVARSDHTGPFGVFGNAGLDGDLAQFVGRSTGWTHGLVLLQRVWFGASL